MTRDWRPLKIFRKPDGGEVLFTQHRRSRELRKEPFPLLDQFPDVSKGDLPLYRENPKYLEFYSQESSAFVARNPQVGDVVNVRDLQMGECVAQSSLSGDKFLVELRSGGRKEINAEELVVVHHNIEGMDREDPEGLLEECTRNYLTMEELKYGEQVRHQQVLDWVLDRPVTAEFDLDFIRQVHLRLFGDLFNWAGEYRTRKLWVGSESFPTTAPRFIDVRMAKFDEKLTPTLEFLGDLKSDNRRFWVELAEIYLDLCKIHPFRDGNGRVCRLLLTGIVANFADVPVPVDWGMLKRASNQTDRAFTKARRVDSLTPLARLIYRAYRRSAEEIFGEEPDKRPKWDSIEGSSSLGTRNAFWKT
jgi:cell filamentation protein